MISSSLAIRAAANLQLSVLQQCIKKGLEGKSARKVAIVICAKMVAKDKNMAYLLLVQFATSSSAYTKMTKHGLKTSYELYVMDTKNALKFAIAQSKSKILQLLVTYFARMDLSVYHQRGLRNHVLRELGVKK
jgi:hypothetical protein